MHSIQSEGWHSSVNAAVREMIRMGSPFSVKRPCLLRMICVCVQTSTQRSAGPLLLQCVNPGSQKTCLYHREVAAPPCSSLLHPPPLVINVLALLGFNFTRLSCFISTSLPCLHAKPLLNPPLHSLHSLHPLHPLHPHHIPSLARQWPSGAQSPIPSVQILQQPHGNAQSERRKDGGNASEKAEPVCFVVW